jgi:hypothetical protein
MRSTTGWNKALKGTGVLAVIAGCLAWGQFKWPDGTFPAHQINRQPAGLSDAPPEGDPTLVEKRLRALNADRHKSLVSDTEKLVKLARQLDAEIASNPTEELTPGELHELAAIEKLAHSVKTKMAQSFGGGPEFKPPVLPLGGPGVE